MLDGKVIDLGFTDPGLNVNLGEDDRKIKKLTENLHNLKPEDRLLLLLVAGIGDRVDRLINMVSRLERSQ